MPCHLLPYLVNAATAEAARAASSTGIPSADASANASAVLARLPLS